MNSWPWEDTKEATLAALNACHEKKIYNGIVMVEKYYTRKKDCMNVNGYLKNACKTLQTLPKQLGLGLD